MTVAEILESLPEVVPVLGTTYRRQGVSVDLDEGGHQVLRVEYGCPLDAEPSWLSFVEPCTWTPVSVGFLRAQFEAMLRHYRLTQRHLWN